MKRFTPRSYLIPVCVAFFLLNSPHLSYAQCAAAPIAAATCTGGNGAASDGLTIGSGATYWVSGSSIFSAITLNGGTLRICGTLIVSTLNLTSGNLIVESGGTLIMSAVGGNTINGGIVIINRGSITSSGSITIQNTNQIYNDLSTSTMTFSGQVTFNSSPTTIVNRGTISFSALKYQANTASFCLQNNSITNIGTLDNETTNSFTYSGTGIAACINISQSAILGHDLAGSSLIKVCKAGSATVTGGATSDASGGWGSAVVYSGCSSCATLLTFNFLSFTATPQGRNVQLQWTTGEEALGDEVFYVERSSNGTDFSTLTSVKAIAGQSSYTASDANAPGPVQYYRVRAVLPGGTNSYSSIVITETGNAYQGMVYPNPSRPNGVVTVILRSSSPATAHLSLIDMAGKVLFTKNAGLTAGSNQLTLDLENITAGIYMLRIELQGSASLYNRLAVI